jgi:hypothetical protein
MLYLLLTNVSGDKLRSIVTTAPASTNTIVAESLLQPAQKFPRAAPIETQPQCFLSLVRPERSGSVPDTPRLDSVVDVSSILADYRTVLALAADDVSAKVPLLVTYSNSLSSSAPASIFSVAFNFSTQSSFEPISAVVVPFLSCSAELDQRSTAIEICLRPIEPMPALLQVAVEYSTSDGRGYTTALPPFALEFRDLCREAMLPPAYEGCARHARAALFDALWQEFNGDGDGPGVSVKVLRASPHGVSRSLHSLAPFVVRGQLAHMQASAQPVNILLWLPAKYHVLLSLLFRADSTLVRMASDRWQLLGHVDTMLDLFMQ